MACRGVQRCCCGGGRVARGAAFASVSLASDLAPPLCLLLALLLLWPCVLPRVLVPVCAWCVRVRGGRYAKKASGVGAEDDDFEPVPDLYVRNQKLSEQVGALRLELRKNQEIAAKAQGTWDKFRKERDFHRMHHKRVMQEKNRLIVDIKRLKKHYSTFEPALEELRLKYESAMKEKMLMRLERDRVAARVEALEAQVKSFEEVAGGGGGAAAGGGGGSPPSRRSATGASGTRRGKGKTGKGKTGTATGTRRGPRDSKLPSDGAVNPHLGRQHSAPEVDRFQLSKTFKGHVNAVSALAFHPKKPILATASDDMTWKMWTVPAGDLIMSGDGHKEWLAGLDFHPAGTHLATAAGDGLVKLWDFASASCSATFSDHTQAVWDCAFHHEGDFLVSCSMDHTAKMWDLNSHRCRQTFRGHVDSVNSICFQPFSNNICTGSGDKTVSLWDVRSGLCIQTLYGHNNACNSVAFNLRGDTIASCDADGVVKLWDVRMVEERLSINAGDHPVNKVSLDRSGKVIACASDDHTVKLFSTEADDEAGKEAGAALATLRGHNDAVQSVLFDPSGRSLVSAGSDNTFRIWAK